MKILVQIRQYENSMCAHHSSAHWVEANWDSCQGGGWGSARAARRAPAVHWQQLRSGDWEQQTGTRALVHRHFRQPLLRPAHSQQWRKGAGTLHWRNPLWLSWWQPGNERKNKQFRCHCEETIPLNISWILIF